MENRKRLDKLEQAIEPREVSIHVDWLLENGLVLDRETGEGVTEDEWRRRHPDDELIVVRYEDGEGEGGEE